MGSVEVRIAREGGVLTLRLALACRRDVAEGMAASREGRAPRFTGRGR